VVGSDGNREGGRCGDRLGAVTTYVLLDNDYVRALLAAMIDEAEGFVVVGSSGSASDALAEIVRLQPRVAVVDGDLRDGDGLVVCRILAATAPAVACVIVAAGVAKARGPAEAAAAGAAAYVLKQPRNFPLIEVIGQVAAGARLLDGPITSGDIGRSAESPA
jgi:DNA-binding NarL/FixJ family response regulator